MATRIPVTCHTDSVSRKNKTEKMITTATFSRIMGYATLTGRYLSVSICVSVATVKERLLTREIKTRKGRWFTGASEKSRKIKLMQVTVPMKVYVVIAALHLRWAETL